MDPLTALTCKKEGVAPARVSEGGAGGPLLSLQEYDAMQSSLALLLHEIAHSPPPSISVAVVHRGCFNKTGDGRGTERAAAPHYSPFLIVATFAKGHPRGTRHILLQTNFL